MPLVSLTIQHGRTLEDARGQLEKAASEVQSRFGAFVQRTEWSEDRSRVTFFAPGTEVELRVDAQNVYVTGDVPLLGKLLGKPFTQGLKRIVEDKFQKRLT